MFKIKLIFVLLFIYLNILHLYSETQIPEGEISGVWNQEGSPYILEGTTNVPIDSLLIINPGVEVIFTTDNNFNIYGTLKTEGSLIDSIYFTVQSTSTPYISFINLNETSQDSSFIDFTCFNGVGIYFENSDYLSIKKSTIKNSKGFLLINSSPILDSLMINNNYKESKGGGIYCVDGSSPFISNSHIINNESILGAGIACEHDSNPILTNVVIMGNNASGSVILCLNSSPTINYSTICNNTAGIAIGTDGIDDYNDYPTVTINYSDISNNHNERAIEIYNANIDINHSTISNNNSGGIFFFGSGILEINNSKITDNSAWIGGAISIEGINNMYTNFVNITRTLISGNSAEEIAGIKARSSILNLTNSSFADL